MLPPGLARRTVYQIDARRRRDSRRDSARRSAPCWTWFPGRGAIPLDRLTREGGKRPRPGRDRTGQARRAAAHGAPERARPAPKRCAWWSGRGRSRRGDLAPRAAPCWPCSSTPRGRCRWPNWVATSRAPPRPRPLQRRGLVRVVEEVVRRDPVGHRPLTPTAPLALTGRAAASTRRHHNRACARDAGDVPATWRDWQRQDRGLPAGAGGDDRAGTPGHHAGARDLADAADDGPLRRALPRPRRPAAQRALGRRARRRMGARARGARSTLWSARARPSSARCPILA